MAENAITTATAETLRSPEEFDDATSKSRPGDTDENVHVSSITSAHVEWLLEYLEMGFEHIYVHNVGQNQREFVDCYGADVLPQFH
jgi:hypothetical protein